MTLRAFKLINGMEIFGRERQTTDTTIMLDDAVIAIIRATSPTESSLQFVPVSPLAKGQKACAITLEKTAIAFEYEPEDEYASGYSTAVSGLVIATR